MLTASCGHLKNVIIAYVASLDFSVNGTCWLAMLTIVSTFVLNLARLLRWSLLSLFVFSLITLSSRRNGDGICGSTYGSHSGLCSAQCARWQSWLQ